MCCHPNEMRKNQSIKKSTHWTLTIIHHRRSEIPSINSHGGGKYFLVFRKLGLLGVGGERGNRCSITMVKKFHRFCTMGNMARWMLECKFRSDQFHFIRFNCLHGAVVRKWWFSSRYLRQLINLISMTETANLLRVSTRLECRAQYINFVICLR